MKENYPGSQWRYGPVGLQAHRGRKARLQDQEETRRRPRRSPIVRLIYKLYLYGDGTSGALGVKEVVKWLNRNGYELVGARLSGSPAFTRF